MRGWGRGEGVDERCRERRSSGWASEGRGGGSRGHLSWTMDEQRERRWSFSLSLSVSPRLSPSPWEPPLLLLPPHSRHLLLFHLSFLLHPASRRLWHTRSSRQPPPSQPPPLLRLCLPLLRPSACLPSLLPGRPGQCWRRSRDLQEICLSEKQLVRLSTANVCMLGPPPLPHSLHPHRPPPSHPHLAVQEPGWGAVGTLKPSLPRISTTTTTSATPPFPLFIVLHCQPLAVDDQVAFRFD